MAKATSSKNPRLEAKRKQIKAENATMETLSAILYQICDICGLDDDKMSRRIHTAQKSDYGRIDGMVNLLASVAHWPAEPGDGSAVAENQRMIKEQLNLDLLLLDDIRRYRGYTSFASDDLTLITGVEPNYEEYEDSVTILLEDMNLTPQRNSFSINPDMWHRLELKAQTRAKDEIEQLRVEIERTKAFMEANAK